jgi:uncharacterized membrane protein
MSKDRLEIFSDAVFAIMLTLLVLELHVPEIADHSSLAQYANAMAPLVPKFISFVLTFVLICIHWVNHHYFFRHIRNVPITVVWLNNLFLLWVCFLPFPTAMLGDHPTDQFPVLLYGANSLLLALTFYALRAYSAHSKLFKVKDEQAEAQGPGHSVPAIVVYAAGIIVSFVSVYLSLVCFVLALFIYFVPNLLRRGVKAAEDPKIVE